MTPGEKVSSQLKQLLTTELLFSRLSNQFRTQASQSLLLEINDNFAADSSNTEVVLRKLITHIEVTHKKKLYFGYATTALIFALGVLLTDREKALWLITLMLVLFMPAVIIANSVAYESSLANADTVLTREEANNYSVTLNFLKSGWKPEIPDEKLNLADRTQFLQQATSDQPQVRKMFIVNILEMYLKAIEQSKNVDANERKLAH